MPQARLLCRSNAGVAGMPKAKRERRERTDNYHLLQQWCRTPEQRLYEGIRPVVLFGIPPAERAQETGLAERSLGRAADAFDTHGIMSLFRPTKAQREDHHRSLPVARSISSKLRVGRGQNWPMSVLSPITISNRIGRTANGTITA